MRFFDWQKKVERFSDFGNDVIVIDGFWSSGKSLISPIVCQYRGVERVRIDVVMEYITCLHAIGKISDDAATWFLSTHVDTQQYNNVIGREINLRWADDTGLHCASDKLGLLLRLFRKDGDGRVGEISGDNLAYAAMTHLTALAPQGLVDALGNRLKFVEMVRSPLHMVVGTEAYIKRFDSPREFSIAYREEGEKVPWFISSNQGFYSELNSTEKALLCISSFYKGLQQTLDLNAIPPACLRIISFEDLVWKTQHSLDILSEFFGRQLSGGVERVLRQQKIPRSNLDNGKGHSSYGWTASSGSDEEVVGRHLQHCLSNCRDEILEDYICILNWYYETFPSRLSEMVSVRLLQARVGA